MSIEVMAIDLSTLRDYYLLREGETEQELLQRAYNDNVENIARYEKIIAEKPECNTDGFFTRQLEEAKRKEYKVITWDEYMELKRKHYIDDGKIIEVTEEDFNNALDVLPPLKWCTIDGIEMFCISEMTEFTYTTQYAHDKHNGKYYCATVDVTDQSTWINNRI